MLNLRIPVAILLSTILNTSANNGIWVTKRGGNKGDATFRHTNNKDFVNSSPPSGKWIGTLLYKQKSIEVQGSTIPYTWRGVKKNDIVWSEIGHELKSRNRASRRVSREWRALTWRSTKNCEVFVQGPVSISSEKRKQDIIPSHCSRGAKLITRTKKILWWWSSSTQTPYFKWLTNDKEPMIHNK